MKNFKSLVLYMSVLLSLHSCSYDKTEVALPANGYPDDVSELIVSRCAVSGCHNDESNQGAGGLNLATWEKLFAGSRGGSVVVPYRPDYSTLCYYTNTDTLQGLVLVPTMPYANAPLNPGEYTLIRNWIEAGAPDKSGHVKFSSDRPASCLYVCNKGCDVVALLDPASGLTMRYIDVGNSQDIEGPCMVTVSADRKFWYVIFSQGTVLQKFRTSDDSKAGELELGPGSWTSIVITPDSKYAFISDAGFNGRIFYVDLESLQVLKIYETGLRFPAGLFLNSGGTLLYATALEGNYIYKLELTDRMNPVISEVSLETGVPPDPNAQLNPCSILLPGDESKYFVVCSKSAELRMLNASNDSLLGTFPTGSNPAEITASYGFGYIFVSCLGVPGTIKKSLINVYDIATGSPVVDIEAGHDSKGIAMDENLGKLFVANRNVTDGGPSAHHGSICDGRNGYLSVILLNQLAVDPEFKVELSVDPFQIGN